MNKKAVVIGEIGVKRHRRKISWLHIQGIEQLSINTLCKGNIIAKGRFSDTIDGYMLIFKTRKAAEQFVKEDTYILKGIIGSYVIRDWAENMMPE